ncbi:winged helix-turn-helix transcriptional regulator [Qipengyuania sp. ASV99]|uniref:winged helix-turn-helix transcriptional regulator n=1 Tax=Qipengyuania sp. ASV99 TaxID=3399681 RepID=UPI003A4C7D66
MKNYQVSHSPCPIGRAARILGDRWTMLILREALLGATRFEEFRERLDINRDALSSRLGILQKAGLMTREPPSGKRALYILTEAALALVPTYNELAEWGRQHLFAEGEAPARWPESSRAFNPASANDT